MIAHTRFFPLYVVQKDPRTTCITRRGVVLKNGFEIPVEIKGWDIDQCLILAGQKKVEDARMASLHFAFRKFCFQGIKLCFWIKGILWKTDCDPTARAIKQLMPKEWMYNTKEHFTMLPDNEYKHTLCHYNTNRLGRTHPEVFVTSIWVPSQKKKQVYHPWASRYSIMKANNTKLI